VNIEISAESDPSGDDCLRIDLDGGGAAVFSPPIPVDAACQLLDGEHGPRRGSNDTAECFSR